MAAVNQHIHVLTLIIKKQGDIPLVRSKAKLFAEICGFSKTRRVQLAVAASELARYLLNFTRGGKASFYIVCRFADPARTPLSSGIKLYFKGKSSCVDRISKQAGKAEPGISPELFKALESVMDELDIQRCRVGVPLEVKAILWGGRESCESLEKKNELIKKQLFADMEESYLENLRAKHEEVLELLKTISRKNIELDKANSELLELSKDMESLVHERTVVEFALRIADRIRNPATVIGGLAKIVLKKLPEGTPERTKLEAIVQEAKKLEAIVKNFEGLAKEQERFFTDIDLKKLVREVVETWRPSFEQKELKLNMKMIDTPLSVRANPRTLKVAALHILKNAVDASPHGASLVIEVTRIDGRPVVSIRDFGPGIKKEIRDKLFKELVTTKPSGTGVGLIMVHHIMREHQGEIQIDSKPGIGTTVRLIFPIRWAEKSS